MTTSNKSFEERRRFPRLKVEVEVEVKILDDIGDSKTSAVNRQFEQRKTKDISPLGVCVETGRHIPHGTILELRFKFPGQTSHGLGRVVWCRDLEGNGVFYAGVEFLAVAQGKIDEFANNIAHFYFEQFTADKDKHFNFLKELMAKFIPKK